MKKKELFYGVATALITPFKNGEVDRESFLSLLDHQVESGIDALVIGGTTGEAATLSDKERYTLFSLARERCQGKVRLIFGTGTNDTSLAIKHTKEAERIGCDGILVVTPYYNKGTAEGIARHYEYIADSVDLPIILYNVPQRTGVNLEFSMLERLAKIENIVGIKEAADSADRLVSVAAFGDELHLYAGNDSAVFTVLSLGGKGVISVVSNLLPYEMSELCRLFKVGEVERARERQIKLLPLIRAMFLETNPAPIKYAATRWRERLGAGGLTEELRLPLCEVSERTRAQIDVALDCWVRQ